jgi:hypothetical protein
MAILILIYESYLSIRTSFSNMLDRVWGIIKAEAAILICLPLSIIMLVIIFPELGEIMSSYWTHLMQPQAITHTSLPANQ